MKTQTVRYKVAISGNRWKYGFPDVKAANVFAEQIRKKTGAIVEIRAYVSVSRAK